MDDRASSARKGETAAAGQHDDRDLSLAGLSAAFAAAISQDQSAAGPDVDGADRVAVELPDGTSAEAKYETAEPVEDPGCPVEPLTILEAMLFVGDPASGSLSSQRLSS